MRTRWIVTLLAALAIAAMFMASWQQRRPDFAAMTMRELVVFLYARQFPEQFYIDAVREYDARPQPDRWEQLHDLLKDQDPQVRSAAAESLRLEELLGPDLNDPDSALAQRAMQLRQLLDDDAVSLQVLLTLASVCDAQAWPELPTEVKHALRRHLAARSPGLPDPFALFCVMQFGRLCLPLQAELLNIDPNINDPGEAAFLPGALGAIAWNNEAVVDRLVTLLGPRHDRFPDVITDTANAIARCGKAAVPAVPRLLELVDSRHALEGRAYAALALAQITRDPDVAERALRILLRDREALSRVREREWVMAASRLAALAPASPLAMEALQALEAAAPRAEGSPDATYDAAIALVAAALGEHARSQGAIEAVAARVASDATWPQTDPAGYERHEQQGGAIELLIDLHLAHPEAKLDLQLIRAQLDSFANAQTTWIRDWAHHQQARLAR